MVDDNLVVVQHVKVFSFSSGVRFGSFPTSFKARYRWVPSMRMAFPASKKI